MRHRPLAPALLALLAAVPLTVQADDGAVAAVRAKVAAAMSAVHSYVVATSATTGFTVLTTFAAPDRFHSVLSYNGSTRDVVLIGPAAYVSEGGQPYRKVDAPADIVAAQTQVRDVPVDRLLPDKLESGIRWGRFATTSAGPQKDQRLVCTYDKKTYRIGECTNEGLKIVFSHYDDPQNVVTAPANVVAPAGAH